MPAVSDILPLQMFLLYFIAYFIVIGVAKNSVPFAMYVTIVVLQDSESNMSYIW